MSGDSADRVAEPAPGCAQREAESERTEQLATAVGSEWSSSYDDWELDEQLRHIGRVLAEAGHESPPGQTSDRGNTVVRVDSAHAGPAGRHLPLPGRQSAGPARRHAGSLPIWTWATMLLGLTAFVCGGVLLGWSIVSGREDLWSIGLPIALGGQIGLLVALVLQLDRLWHDNRSTEAKLDRVDDQLHDLKTATTMLGTSHHSASGTFYAHMADGAGPQLLLTDLKSQLDLLALKIGQEE